MFYENIPDDLLENKIKEICENIGKKGKDSMFCDVFNVLSAYIEDHLENFYPVRDYDINS